MRPSVSIPASELYAHRVPGWKSSGAAPSVGMYPARLSVDLLGAIREASREPAPPLASPEVCVIRSRTVISRLAGTV